MHIADLSQYAPLAAIAVAHRLTHPAVILRIARVGESVVHLVRALKAPSVPTVAPFKMPPLDVDKIVAAMVAPAVPQPTGEPAMTVKLNLADLAGAMASAAAAVASSTQFAGSLYSFAAKMIASVEQAYTAAGAGDHKRAAVIAAVASLEKSLAAANPGSMPSIMSEITPWLDAVIGAYNAANDVLGGAMPHVDVPTLTEKLSDFAVRVENVAAELAPAAEVVLKTTESLFATPALTPASVPAANTQGV